MIQRAGSMRPRTALNATLRGIKSQKAREISHYVLTSTDPYAKAVRDIAYAHWSLCQAIPEWDPELNLTERQGEALAGIEAALRAMLEPLNDKGVHIPTVTASIKTYLTLRGGKLL